MKTNYKKVLCVAVLLGSAVTISAQEKKEQQDLDREMTLEREYDPTVQDANKVNTLPEIKEPEVIKHSIDYSDFTLATDPEKQISVLPSADFMTQMDYNKRRGYLNVGAGMHLNVDGDFGCIDGGADDSAGGGGVDRDHTWCFQRCGISGRATGKMPCRTTAAP